MLKFLAILSVLGICNNVYALEKIGRISCNFFDDKKYSIRGEIYGEPIGYYPVYADVKIFSNDKSLKQTTTLKTWSEVPYSQDSLWSIVFQNDDVFIEAFFDDVGAMSSLNYDNNLIRLECDVDFN